jgi:hypothetical protein
MSEPKLSEQLKHFERLVGRTFRGVLNESTADKPMIDVSRWERAMNGLAVRNLHSVNDGEYGGETVYYWDRQEQKLRFFYFTTAGFFTQGTITFEDDVQHSHEFVTGNAHGVTEVRATSEFLPDGRLKTQSEYLQNGKWVEGHAAVYVETPGAEVNFR